MLSPGWLWERLSLTLRVMLWSALALLFASTLLLVASTNQGARFAAGQIDERLSAEIESLLPAITEWAVIGDHASIEQTFRQRVRLADVRHIGWINDRGKVLEAVDKDDALRAPAWFVQWVGLLSPKVTRTLSIGGRNYGQVTVEMTAMPAQNRLWDDFLGHLAILALALLLSLAGILVILRRGLRPLSDLTRGAVALAQGDFSRRIPRQGSPELASLIDAFNHMSSGIATAQGALADEAERL
jgi:methyl-accepting chemotaxis protein